MLLSLSLSSAWVLRLDSGFCELAREDYVLHEKLEDSHRVPVEIDVLISSRSTGVPP